MVGSNIDGRVLVTGGCGSVGSVLVRYLLEHCEPSKIVVFDNDERRLFEQQVSSEYPESRVEFELGDVRDLDRLNGVVRDARHIVHAAALKQVPQCERQPYESIKTNVDGTNNIITLAKRHDVESVLTVSTDKATNPSSVMGASKLLAERVTLRADQRTGPDGPSFSSVRLGNVIGSSGSVVPLFLQQIEDGGPVTLTDDRMTRFAISKADAAAFITGHIGEQTSGVTYLPQLRSLRIEDLAEVMCELYADRSPGSAGVQIEEVGRRPGERLHEVLIGPDERHRTAVTDEKYVVHPPATDAGSQPTGMPPHELPEEGLSSHHPSPMNYAEIRELLEQSAVTEPAAAQNLGGQSVAQQND